MTRPGIELRSPGLLANIYPLGQWTGFSSWRWRTPPDCETPNSPDTPQMPLAGFASILGRIQAYDELSWWSIFLLHEQNFFNHLLTVINWTFLFNKVNVFVVLVALRPSSNSKAKVPKLDYVAHSSEQFCISHTEWSNAQHVSAPTIRILQTIVSNFHCWNWFGYVIYVRQNSTHQLLLKILTHITI